MGSQPTTTNKGDNVNNERKNGKAWKKRPKITVKTREVIAGISKTIGGYSPAKLAERAQKRSK